MFLNPRMVKPKKKRKTRGAAIKIQSLKSGGSAGRMGASEGADVGVEDGISLGADEIEGSDVQLLALGKALGTVQHWAGWCPNNHRCNHKNPGCYKLGTFLEQHLLLLCHHHSKRQVARDRLTHKCLIGFGKTLKGGCRCTCMMMMCSSSEFKKLG